ncbi:hypothetical protein [Bifidobacterium parmae]|uniref:Uncharacterized protein n=1 Tax=Bifidobacterium parmae TaxID=361854 RepID=A0A2N5IZ88_9BIFI|nr:hypothetical protein [Bifidobacterium parmae]PLS27267.1 hypothetical protein Uis4E_1663 [Bifidobacterium parmae]
MSSVDARRKTRAFNNRIVWRKAVQGARRDGTSLETELNRVVSKYAAVADSTTFDDCDYMNPDLLPGESVHKTSDDTRTHFESLLAEVRRGV